MEAVATGSILHIVHVDRWRTVLDAFGSDRDDTWATSAATSADIVAEGQRRAQLVAPSLEITLNRQPGTSATNILRRIEDGSVLVLSSHEHLRLPHRAEGATVVTGRFQSTQDEPPRGGVVVGSASDGATARALEVAFTTARQHKSGLTVVDARTQPSAGQPPEIVGSVNFTLLPNQVLELTLRTLELTFADVPVRRVVLFGLLEEVLAAQSAAAVMVVFGQPSHRRLHWMTSSAAPRRLLVGARSPVSLVWPARRHDWSAKPARRA
jgi:hypothetical protein